MQTTQRNRLALIASAAALTLLTACSRQDDTTATSPAVESTAPTTAETAPATTTPPMTTPDTTAGTTATDSGTMGSTAGQSAANTMERAGDAVERGADNVAAATGDASLTAKVKTALITAPDLGSLKIDVDSSSGVVTLNGEVKNTAEKDKAEQVASSVTGVTSVVNKLQVSNS